MDLWGTPVSLVGVLGPATSRNQQRNCGRKIWKTEVSVREEVAWAGGLFEGEGCISKTGNYAPVLVLEMTDEVPVKWFHRIVGTGHVRLRLPSQPRRKPVWSWRATSYESAQAVLATVWPWLGPRRRARAIEIFSRARLTPLPLQKRFLLRTTCSRGHLFSEFRRKNRKPFRYCQVCSNLRAKSYAARKQLTRVG